MTPGSFHNEHTAAADSGSTEPKSKRPWLYLLSIAGSIAVLVWALSSPVRRHTGVEAQPVSHRAPDIELSPEEKLAQKASESEQVRRRAQVWEDDFQRRLKARRRIDTRGNEVPDVREVRRNRQALREQLLSEIEIAGELEDAEVPEKYLLYLNEQFSDGPL